MAKVADHTEMQPGAVLAGRYELGALLGEGGFGTAYLARDRARFGTVCVVKLLRSAHATNEIVRRLFEREARVLCELEHPGIPKLQAYFETGGQYCVVQDYVEGEVLRTRLARESRLDETFVRDVVVQVLDVLEYLHGRVPAVIHRDIKPANLIVGVDGRISLIDFGAVREAVETVDGSSNSSLTRIGTPGYTPAEQAQGWPVPASDLYALGATALHLVSGVEPREWFHDGQLAWRGRLHCSPAFAAFLDGTLCDLPDRLKSASAARALLQPSSNAVATVVSERGMTPRSVTGAPAPAMAPAPPAPVKTGGRSRTLLYAAAALGVTAATVAASLVVRGRSTSATPTPAVAAPARDTTGAAAGEPCPARTLRSFRTESQFDLRVLCPAGWSAYHSSELRATRLMAGGDATQVWASLWSPADGAERASAFAERWRESMQSALGPLSMELVQTLDEHTARYRVVGRRFARAEPGSLQIEQTGSGGNRFYAWSLVIGATALTRPTAQEVLTSIEYLAPEAGTSTP